VKDEKGEIKGWGEVRGKDGRGDGKGKSREGGRGRWGG